MKEQVCNSFEAFFSIKVRIEEIKSQKLSKMTKESFCRVISLLEEINEISETLAEAGVDVSIYDSLFFEIIQELMENIFNSSQIERIQKYMFGDDFIEDVSHSTSDIETPEELWEVISKLK